MEATVFTLSIWIIYLLTILVLKFEHPFYYLLMCVKTAGGVANSMDPDQMLHSAASNLRLYCLLRLKVFTIVQKQIDNT